MLLSHPDRSDRICLLTLDNVLVRDVIERLNADSRFAGVEIVRPAELGRKIQVDDVLLLAAVSVRCRLIVLDTRRSLLPRLREVFNRVSGYNRMDFNRSCASVVISDGPHGFPSHQTGISAFSALLAEAHHDYNAAAFFFDPLIHDPHSQWMTGDPYSMMQLPASLRPLLPNAVRLPEDARTYLRRPGGAADIMTQLGQTHAAWARHVREHFPAWARNAEAAMSPNGFCIPGESLPLRVYPFHFEDCLAELLLKLRHPKDSASSRICAS